jgi:hypothetical protein
MLPTTNEEFTGLVGIAVIAVFEHGFMSGVPVARGAVVEAIPDFSRSFEMYAYAAI